METNTLFLTIAGLLPAAILCVYVFLKDQVEREPISLLLKLLLFGAISCIPAALGEDLLFSIIDGAFAKSIYYNEAGEVLIKSTDFHLYQFILAFIGVALVEEFFKWIFLIRVTKDNENFNCLFDGLIYAVFVSLGFAAFENVLYVLDGGLRVAILRAILSVPGHMFFGVMMGYHYSIWHIIGKANAMEKSLKAAGKINIAVPEISYVKHMRLSLLVPIAAHGFYDFCCFVDSPLTTVLLYAFVIFMYVHCFRKIKRMSISDASDVGYAKMMLIRKYPLLQEYIRTEL